MSTYQFRAAVHEAAKRLWSELSPADRSYRIGGLLGLVGVVAIYFRAEWISNFAMAAAMICLGATFSYECYRWASPKLNNPIFKAIWWILAYVSAAISAAVSNAYVNSATGQDPSYFRLASLVFAPIAFTPVLAAFVSLVSMAAALIVFILGAMRLGLIGKNDANSVRFTQVMRVLGVFSVGAMAAMIANPSKDMEAKLRWGAGSLALLMDMHTDPTCSPVVGIGCCASTKTL
jgi:hypothetical protein